MVRVRGFALLQESGQYARIGRGGQFGSKLGRDRLDSVPTLWSSNYAADREGTFFVQVLGHRHIRGHHEAFDDVLGHVMTVYCQVFNFPIFHHRRGFDRTKRERAILLANAPQFFRYLLLEAKLRLHARRVGNGLGYRTTPLQPGAGRTVSQLRAVVKPGGIKIVAIDLARVQDVHFDDHGQTVLAIAQRSQVGRKFFRQHREHRHACIDRGGLGCGVAVGG